MRIAIGGISHETNTFSPLKTDLALFERRGVHSSEALLPAFAGTKTILGGFIDGARSEGFEAVPTMLAEAAPSGTVTTEAFDRLTSLLIDGLREAGPIDGVLLELHGAMVAENARDGEDKGLIEIEPASHAAPPRLPPAAAMRRQSVIAARTASTTKIPSAQPVGTRPEAARRARSPIAAARSLFPKGP